MIGERFMQRVRDYRAATVTYRPGVPDRCSSCGKSHWLVGRATAECASCGNVRMIDRGRPADAHGPVVLVRSRHDALPRPCARQ